MPGFETSLHLGDLADPNRYTEPISLRPLSEEKYLEQLRQMMVIRYVEEKIGEKVTDGTIRCPCHLGIGQEAIAVGVASNLRKTDRTFGGHRSHAHYLAQGGSVYGLLAEVLGKEAGCSKGMGGSMHLYDGPNGFLGSVPIVAGTVSLGVGAALAAKLDRKGDVGVSYFGDGAAEEGSVHESMNFAAAYKLPVLFICENNFFSSHLHIDLRQPSNAVSRFAQAHHIPFEIVDGNDIVQVQEASARLLERSRNGEGPGFLEAVTYRWRGHVGPREDIDVGVMRKENLALWKQRDPIRRLTEGLEKSRGTQPDIFRKMEADVRFLVENEWRRAEEAPYPTSCKTMEYVYSRQQ